MFSIKDTTVFDKFEQAELEHPTPRKKINGRIIYVSRSLEMPSELDLPVLCDLAQLHAERKGMEKTCSQMSIGPLRSSSVSPGAMKLISGMSAAWYATIKSITVFFLFV